MTKRQQYKVAIIGCGRIAGHHCRAVTATPGFSLAAVSDLDEKKSLAYAKEFSVPCYQNLHDMLEEHGDIDIVVIATPSGMHYEHAMIIMQQYQKHIIVEKPTFMTLSQLQSAYDYAKNHNLRIFPVFQNRHNLAVQRVKQAIDNGELGDVRTVSVRVRWCRPQSYYDLAPWRGTYSHDGGALTNQGIHHVDLLRYLAGDVSQVSAQMRTLGVKVEVEDTVVGIFNYHSGAVGNLEVTTAARPDNYEASLSIVGSKGLAQIGGIAVNELQVFTPEPTACERYSENFSACVYGEGHKAIYKDIHHALINNENYQVSEQDCAATIKLLHAFYVSDEKNSWVSFADTFESKRLGMTDESISDLYRFKQASVV